jgi:tetratricopeptide (TPR) repeat protein
MTTDPSNGSGTTASGSKSELSRRGFLRTSALTLALQAAWPRRFSLTRAAASTSTAGPPGLPIDRGCLSPTRTVYPPQLQSIISKLDTAADDFPSEVYAEQIGSVLTSWSNALCRSVQQLAPIRDSLSNPVSVSLLQPYKVDPLRTDGPLVIERRHFRPPQAIPREQFISSFSTYLLPFAAIELVELEIYGLRTESESPLRVETEVRCDFVGTAKGGTREQRVGSWSISWIQDEEQHWIVQSWTLNSELRSRLRGPGFTEITADCLAMDATGMKQLLPGVDDWRAALDGASGIDVYGNHGVAVGDIEGSGFDSFYVCQPSGLPNRLYRNRGDGTFEDITEMSGTGILDGTASALFVDFQNRGQQDLLVVRTAGPLLFVNQGAGKFELRTDAFQYQSAPEGTFTSAAVADYDRDGLLDVYFCVYSYYQGLNQYQYPSPYYDAQNGPPNFLFRNRGDGTFEDVTAASGLNQNNNRFSFAAAWCDYDNSGWPSLYVANDFGRKNLYHNNGNGTFTDVADELGVEDYGPGMSTCWLDYDNDGAQDVYVANMWLKEGKRITSNDRFLPNAPPAVRSLYQKHNAGNSMYRNVGNGTFENKTAEAGSAMGRWSWSCGSWDFDHDGYPDLYVANGFVSGSNSYDLQSFFWRQVAQRSLGAAADAGEYEVAWNAVNELVRADFSWSGFQRNVFFANNHNASFSDVSGVVGLDLRDDSRAFALSDFDHDGRLEFVLKNRTGPQLRIMRNDLQGIGNSIALRLTGKASNRDAIGATVTIESEGRRQTKFISAGSGFASQHTKELSFGVGNSLKDVSVSVRWPAGSVEHYESVPVNHRVEIKENQKEFESTEFRPASTRPKKLATRVPPPSPPASIRTPLIAPLFGPGLVLLDLAGRIHDLGTQQGGSKLLCFFSLDCGDSSKQLEQLRDAAAEMSAANVAVFAVMATFASDRPALEQFVKSERINFPVLLGNELCIGAWNVQYRYLFDRRRDMSFPMSFLLNAEGAVVTIYQGVTQPAIILQDANSNSSSSSPEDRFARAMPFPGPYYGSDLRHNYFTFGIAFAEYGYPDEALAAFQRVIDSDPNNPAAWFNVGTIYLNKKLLPEAQKNLLEAVRLNPKDAAAWNNLGMASGQLGNYDEALNEFKKSARANPNFMLPVQNMIRIYEFQSRPADAQQELEELVLLAPENADLRVGLANTLMAQQQNERARKELEIARSLHPERADIVNNLGVVFMRLGQTKEALAEFEESQKLAPDFDRPFVNAALIFQGAGQLEKARQTLGDFLARHPENADVRSALDKMVAR